MRKMLCALAWASTLLMGVVFIVLFLFISRPQVILGEQTVGSAIKLFGKSYAPRWSRLQFNAASLGNRRHRYAIKAADLCVAKTRGDFSACFSDFELVIIAYYSLRGLSVERVERLTASSGDVRIDLRRGEERCARQAIPWPAHVPIIETFSAALSTFSISSDKFNAKGALRADLVRNTVRPLSVTADLEITGVSGLHKLKGELAANTDALKGMPPTFIDLAANADLEPSGRARAAFRVNRAALRYFGSGSAEVTPSTGAVRAFRLTNCKGDAPLRPGADYPSGVDLACRFELLPTKKVKSSIVEIATAVTHDVGAFG